MVKKGCYLTLHQFDSSSILRLSYLLLIPTSNKTLTMNACKFTESVLDDLHLVNESGARFWTLENDPTSCHQTHV